MANMYLQVATEGTWFIIDNDVFQLDTGVYFDYFGVDLCGYKLHVKKHTARQYEIYLTKGKYKSDALTLYKDEATRIILVEFINSPKYVGSRFIEGLQGINNCFDDWCDSKFYNSFRIHPIKSLSVEDLLWQCLKLYPKMTIKINQSKTRKGFFGVSLGNKRRLHRKNYKPFLKSALLYSLYEECKNIDTGMFSL